MPTEAVYATELCRRINVGNVQIDSGFTFFARGDSDTPLAAVRKAAERENPGWAAVHAWESSPQEVIKFGKLSFISDNSAPPPPKSSNPFENW
jgi:hypothetical protein